MARWRHSFDQRLRLHRLQRVPFGPAMLGFCPRRTCNRRVARLPPRHVPVNFGLRLSRNAANDSFRSLTARLPYERLVNS